MKRAPRPHWSVTVSRNGEEIVTIESNCVSGREISPADEETIRTAAHHLLGFIGDGALAAMPAQQWRPISEAPSTGEHIIVADFTPGDHGFGRIGPTWPDQPRMTVAHWHADGFYASVFEGVLAQEPQQPQRWTHWQPLLEPPIVPGHRGEDNG